MYEDNLDENQQSTYQQQGPYQSTYQHSAFEPGFYDEPPRKKRRAAAFIGKALLCAVLVACISIASVTGYIWITGDPAAVNASATTVPALTAGDTTAPYVKANYTLGQTEGALTIPEIFVKASPWVVSIECQYEMSQANGWPYGQGMPSASSSGTGIIMTENGYILTNHHVVDGASVVSVTANGEHYDATVVGLDEKTDIAVLKIDAKGLSAAEFGDSTQLVVGEPAIVIGNPLGTNLADTLTQGVISATERQIEFTDSTNSSFFITLIQTDAAVSPGNSGGPLINSRGQVVGVINSKISADNVEGIGFAIPAKMALAIAQDLIDNGKVTIRPMLGISVRTVTEAQAKQHNEVYKDDIAAGSVVAVVPGIFVVSVEPGSNADRGGMKVDDEIIAFNGVKVGTATELNYEKEKCFVGDTAKITVIRDGVEMELTINFTSGDTV